MNEDVLRKIQAVAAIGSGVVALHGVTTRQWERRHSLFVGLGLAASVALFVLPRIKGRATTAEPT